jgi:hypothetical protein
MLSEQGWPHGRHNPLPPESLTDAIREAYQKWIEKGHEPRQQLLNGKRLTLLLNTLQSSGFQLTVWSPYLLHTYRADWIEQQLWKGTKLVGLSSRPLSELQHRVLFYLEWRRDWCERRRKHQDALVYKAATERLRKLWYTTEAQPL